MRMAASDVRIGGGFMLATAGAWPLLGRAGLHAPACPLLTITGVPCPLCGMTTSVVAAVHGDLLTALAANPFGLVAILVAAWLLVDRSRRWLTVPAWALAGAAAVSWGFQLVRFS